MAALYEIKDEQAILHLHQGQAAVWRSKARFVWMLAGTQAGKTAFGPWWLWQRVKERGAGDYLAVAPSYDLFKLKMAPELLHVFVHVLRIGRWWAGDKLIELCDPNTGEFLAKHSYDPMWGRIILRSASAGGGLESATAQAAWLDEAGQDEFTLETWEAVQRRLSLAQGRVLGTTTLYNVGWLKTQVYDAWADGDKTHDVIQFDSTLNPAFPVAEFERARATMPAWRFSMLYEGRFARPAGLIYEAFTDANLVDAWPIPASWPRVVGLDFGGANTVTLWLAMDPRTEVWYVYRETLRGGLSTQQHVRHAREDQDGDDVTFVGGAPSETQPRMDWAAAGIEVEQPPIADVEAGIERVIGMFRTGRLRVFRTCKGLRDELGSYRRKLDSEGQPTDAIVDKRQYHRLDALRYGCARILEGSMVQQPGWLF